MSITKLRAKAEELFGNDYTEFEEEDVFNKGNTLRGCICRRSTELYGALLITHIIGIEDLQLVYGTPKMHYPFDKLGRYNFPSAKLIEVFEKLDGTNILAFQYQHNGRVYQTYKTRLTPTVRSGRFGDFYGMWVELLEKYPQINKVCFTNGCNVSFELYGARNKHLLWYDVPLECALLFGVTGGGTIIPPTKMDLLGLPMVQKMAEVTSYYVESYKQQQLFLEDGLREVEDGYEGVEGQVWYLQTIDGRTIQFKCKPETIELIHFASGGLGKNMIRATAYNVFENQDELTIEAVVALLLEEFSERQIQACEGIIQKVVSEVRFEVEQRQAIVEDYKTLNMDINLDKVTVMRWFSERYPKKEMRRVYTVLKTL